MARHPKTTSGENIYDFFFRKNENGRWYETLHPDRIINYSKFIQALGIEIPKCIRRCTAESDWCTVRFADECGYTRSIRVFTKHDLWKRLSKSGAIINKDSIAERQNAINETIARVINIYNAQGCTFNF